MVILWYSDAVMVSGGRTMLLVLKCMIYDTLSKKNYDRQIINKYYGTIYLDIVL